MDRIANRDDLATAIGKVDRYQALVKKYTSLMNRYREMVVHYLELKNLKSVMTEDGDTWQKRQSTRVNYQLDGLRRLLRRHRIDESVVIKQRMVEEVDEDALLKLLKGKVLTIDEYESIAIRQTSKPFIVKLHSKEETAPIPIRLGRHREGERGANGTGRRAQLRQGGRRS